MLKAITLILFIAISLSTSFADDITPPTYPVGCLGTGSCPSIGLPDTSLSVSLPIVSPDYTVVEKSVEYPLSAGEYSIIGSDSIRPGNGWLSLNVDPLIRTFLPSDLLTMLAPVMFVFSPGDVKIVFDKGLLSPFLRNITGNSDNLVVNTSNDSVKATLERYGIVQVRASAIKQNDNSLFSGMASVFRTGGKLLGVGW